MPAPAKRGPEICRILKEKILDGTYSGSLPGIGKLAAEFKVNILTVFRAVAALEEDGYVIRKPRLGTFITRLKRKRTGTLGLVLPSVKEPLGNRLWQGVQDGAEAKNQAVIVHNYYGNYEKPMEYVRKLISTQQVDGLVLWLVPPVTDPLIPFLTREGFPFVLVDVEEKHDFKCNTVSAAEDNLVSDAMTHLIGKGHRKIAFVNDNLSPLGSFNHKRHEQYCRSLKAAGGSPSAPISLQDLNGKSMAGLVKTLKISTAVFCATDRAALQLYSICAEQGIKIPVVAGYDNTIYSRALNFTSIDQHYELMGKKAVEIIIDEIEGRSKGPVNEIISSELVIRGNKRTAAGGK